MTAVPSKIDSPPGDPATARRRKRRGSWARWVLATLFTLAIGVVTLPDLLFGLDRHLPFVAIVSVRPQLLLGLAGLAALLLVVLVFTRRVLPFVLGTLAVLAVGATLVVPRMTPDPAPTGGTPFTVLALNTYEGQADPEELASMIAARNPDVVALGESGETFSRKIAPLVEPLGYRVHTAKGGSPDGDDISGVTALTADRLGDVETDTDEETTAFPALELTGGELGDLTVVAFHGVAPRPTEGVDGWANDVRLLSTWCSGSGPAIVAGDFNATLDHSALRESTAGCGDAATQRGQGVTSTWGFGPLSRPFGPQIDHVFMTEGIEAETFEIHDVDGTDHRAVLTTLRLPSEG